MVLLHLSRSKTLSSCRCSAAAVNGVGGGSGNGEDAALLASRSFQTKAKPNALQTHHVLSVVVKLLELRKMFHLRPL